MKNLILISLITILVSCIKNDTVITPPVETYKYDSIHKQLIGKWYTISQNPIDDSFRTYVISKDSFNYTFKDKLSIDSLVHNDVHSYKFITKDSLEGQILRIIPGGMAFKKDKLKIEFFTKDSLLIHYFRPSNLASGPLYIGVILKRYK